jgi:hypothetical protein
MTEHDAAGELDRQTRPSPAPGSMPDAEPARAQADQEPEPRPTVDYRSPSRYGEPTTPAGPASPVTGGPENTDTHDTVPVGFRIAPAFSNPSLAHAFAYSDMLKSISPMLDLAISPAALISRPLPNVFTAHISSVLQTVSPVQQALASLNKQLSASLVPLFTTPVASVARAVAPDLGLLSVTARMLQSRDLGLLGYHRQVLNGAAAQLMRGIAPSNLVVPYFSTYSAGTARLLGGAPIRLLTEGLMETCLLTSLFQGWRELADSASGVLQWLARAAYLAATRARTAVVRGEYGPVKDFIRTWLDLPATRRRVEAASAALLEEGWDTGLTVDSETLLADLRRRADRQAHVLRPIWETQLNHRPVGMLGQPVSTDGTTIGTIADLIPDPRTAEDLALAADWEQGRVLLQILGRLKPEERRITEIYAGQSNLTWTQAASAAGADNPPAIGERVRRKLKRLGAEHNRRLALQTACT